MKEDHMKTTLTMLMIACVMALSLTAEAVIFTGRLVGAAVLVEVQTDGQLDGAAVHIGTVYVIHGHVPGTATVRTEAGQVLLEATISLTLFTAGGAQPFPNAETAPAIAVGLPSGEIGYLVQE